MNNEFKKLLCSKLKSYRRRPMNTFWLRPKLSESSFPKGRFLILDSEVVSEDAFAFHITYKKFIRNYSYRAWAYPTCPRYLDIVINGLKAVQRSYGTHDIWWAKSTVWDLLTRARLPREFNRSILNDYLDRLPRVKNIAVLDIWRNPTTLEELIFMEKAPYGLPKPQSIVVPKYTLLMKGNFIRKSKKFFYQTDIFSSFSRTKKAFIATDNLIQIEKTFDGNKLFNFTSPKINAFKKEHRYFLTLRQKPLKDWDSFGNSLEFVYNNAIIPRSLRKKVGIQTSPYKNSFFISNNNRLLNTTTLLVLPTNTTISIITNSFDVIHS